jgi:aminoglycoside phosphotransferase family enzyme
MSRSAVREARSGDGTPGVGARQPDGEPFTAVIETASSVVVLIGPLAYKSIKPVVSGGRDLTSRKARLALLRRQVEADRGPAPVCLGLSELQPLFHPGDPGEPVLVLRRIPQATWSRRDAEGSRS